MERPGPETRVRVLVVDDSAFMRNALQRMLASDPGIDVVGTARDGAEALEKARALAPDVVTMDVEMPRMDGLEALRRLMETAPVPVIMVSAYTTDGARATLDALDLGAVDFLPKNLSDLSVDIVRIREALVEKVRQIGLRRGAMRQRRTGRLLRFPPPASAPAPAERAEVRRAGIVVIGASTGGPKALQEILPRLPAALPVPVVVAQHMPPAFTGPFAERLDQMCRLRVKEAEEGEPLRPGVVLVAPGRGHLTLVRRPGREAAATVSEGRGDLVFRPSVDLLLTSAAEAYPGRVLAVVLTGMGNDGEEGVRAVRASGGRAIVQDEETSVVYGMGRAVVEAGLADRVLPVNEIAGEILASL